MTRPDKGKSVEGEAEDYVLTIPRDQLIERNIAGNSEFCSKLLREVDGSYYSELGWERVFEELREDAIKVRKFIDFYLCTLFYFILFFVLFLLYLTNISFQQMMRASWSLELMKTIDKAYSKKNKRLEELKTKLELAEEQNAQLTSDLKTAQDNEREVREANSTLVSERAEIHSEYLRYKKSSEDFEAKLKAEQQGRAEDIAKLTEDCIEMFSKGYNKCKYNLFKEYRDKRAESWDVDDFIMDFEEEEKLETELREAEEAARAEKAKTAVGGSTSGLQ